MSALSEFLDPPPDGAAVAVQVEPVTGRGTWGVEYGPPVDVWAWIDRTVSLVRTLDGDEVVSAAGLWVAPQRAAPLTLGAKVTLPGEDRPRTIATRADRTQGAELGLPVHVEVRLS